MQRSQVKEFKSSASTLFNSTLLGTHSILAMRQNSPRNDLHQLSSRFGQIPHEQSVDIAAEPKMVLVFQAMQIERLATEADLLRGRLKQRQGIVVNAGSYEVQIRELIDKCHKLQDQKFSFREELAQAKEMNDMIFSELTSLKGRYEEVDFASAQKYKLEKQRNQDLILQIQKWKSRYSCLDKNKSQELDSARRTMQIQRESQLNSGSKQLLLKFQAERQELLTRLREKKEELNQKDLEMKKLSNCFQQAQVKLQEQDSSIESFEEKVAMLSQQTYRLSELVRAKSQEIRNLKINNQNDLSIRLSQLNTIDESKNKINNRLRQVEDNNEELKINLNAAESQMIDLRRKVSETERIQFQLRESKKELQTKMKALERKDRKIMILEEQHKKVKQLQQELSSFKRLTQDQGAKIKNLQEILDEKINELRSFHQNYSILHQQHQNHMNKVTGKMREYERLYQNLENNYNQLLSSDVEMKQKSSVLELQARQSALVLKEKDYNISSLQNQLKQVEVKYRNSQEKYRGVIEQLQRKINNQHKNFEQKTRDIENRKREAQLMNKQNQSRNRQYEIKNRQLQYKFTSMNNHCRQLEDMKFRKQEEINQLKNVINNLMSLQDQLSGRQTQITVQIRSFQSRLSRIEQIILSLRNKLGERYKAAQDNVQKLAQAQFKIDDLQEWFFNIAQKLNQPVDDSPYASPKKRESMSPTKPRQFYSPEPSPTYKSNYAQSTSIYGFKDHSVDHNRINNNTTSVINKQIPTQFLVKFVLLCAEVQTLRKKVGDKQAKMQTMRSSIASKNNSQATIINGLTSSQSSTNSGFFTSREKSLNRKGNIYY